MKNIKILDCTLRDGAHINQGIFGRDRAIRILNGLEKANVDFVELGFIEPKSAKPKSTYFSSVQEAEDFFSLKKKFFKIKKGLMVRTDRCDLNSIEPNKNIDFIRIAFYPSHQKEVIKYSSHLTQNNYDVYLNLIASTSYDDLEIKELINNLYEKNNFLGISIVDTYGALSEKKLINLINIFEKNLKKNKKLGLHLHENLNRSSLLYNLFIKKVKQENIIMDCSLGGMGRIPGNFPTEVCASLINEDFNKNYDLDLLVKITVEEIEAFKQINDWGYLPIYAMSGILNIDRSYPEFFQKNGLTSYENICAQKIVSKVTSKRKFDSDIAKKTLKSVNDKKCNI